MVMEPRWCDNGAQVVWCSPDDVVVQRLLSPVKIWQQNFFCMCLCVYLCVCVSVSSALMTLGSGALPVQPWWYGGHEILCYYLSCWLGKLSLWVVWGSTRIRIPPSQLTLIT